MMNDQPIKVDDTVSLLASQLRYYDERADDYRDAAKPPDRNHPGLMQAELGRPLVDEFRPTGSVLELACGNGFFTSEIVRYAQSVTAVDASPRMLAINQSRVDSPSVTYVEADIFAWQPDRTYDAVFFGFWLSPRTAHGV
jgi:demethylmenaquinone methyltransferase/2-methoxy-6-polyprenyl-1,4-benzoquinol methylase